MNSNPSQDIGKSVENKGGTAAAKGETSVDIKKVLPAKTEKGPLVGANRTDPEGMFDVDFTHEGIWAKVSNHLHSIIEFCVFTSEVFSADAIIDGVATWRGQV